MVDAHGAFITQSQITQRQKHRPSHTKRTHIDHVPRYEI